MKAGHNRPFKAKRTSRECSFRGNVPEEGDKEKVEREIRIRILILGSCSSGGLTTFRARHVSREGGMLSSVVDDRWMDGWGYSLKGRRQTGGRRRERPDFYFCGVHMFDEVDALGSVARLVVVPGNELDEVVGEGNAGLGVEDGDVGVADEVRGDDVVIGVAKDAGHGSIRRGLDGSFDVVVGSAFR